MAAGVENLPASQEAGMFTRPKLPLQREIDAREFGPPQNVSPRVPERARPRRGKHIDTIRIKRGACSARRGVIPAVDRVR